MRLWTIHPRLLDLKGLLAAWREGLLAQQVLLNRTRGYRSHPQLRRFKSSANPVGAIARYLRAIQEEAARRGYNFNADKIGASDFEGKITCTRGQLVYEWEHLKRKVKARDACWFQKIEGLEKPTAHPLFKIVEGEVEDWEMVPSR